MDTEGVPPKVKEGRGTELKSKTSKIVKLPHLLINRKLTDQIGNMRLVKKRPNGCLEMKIKNESHIIR